MPGEKDGPGREPGADHNVTDIPTIARRTPDLDAYEAEFAVDAITFAWAPDGRVEAFPNTARPWRLTYRLKKLIDVLEARPELIVCSSGACVTGCAHDEAGQ